MEFTTNIHARIVTTLCVVSLSPALVFAGGPPPLEERGSIKSVDAGTHTLVVTEHKKNAEQKFQWNDQTKFIAGDKNIKASALKAGEHVQVAYAAGGGVPVLQTVRIIPAKTVKPATTSSPAKGNDA